MQAPFIFAIHVFFFLIFANALFRFSQSQARQSPRHPRESTYQAHSLVLGMTHSRTILPKPKSFFIKTTEISDIVEPLKEIRDGYLISLNLGTPPQVISAYMDTGSDLTWVPCGNLSFECMDCGDYRNNKPMSAFSPSRSSSSSRDSCASPLCIDIHSSDNSLDPCAVAGCSLSTVIKATCYRPCPSFAYTYGEGVVFGSLTRDTLRVHGGGIGLNTSTLMEFSNFGFGCVGSTYHEPLGIAGFGKGPLSLPSQLGFLRKGFSHCFLAFKFANNPNISSPLVVGDLAISSKEHFPFTPMLKSPMYPNYYYIGLEGITVGNSSSSTSSSTGTSSAGARSTITTEVPLSLREFDESGNGGMLIDSGTTYTHLPEPLYSQLLAVLQSAISYPRASEVEMRSGFDLCYRIPYNYDDGLLPTITFHFLNNVSLVLPQGNYFYAMGAPTNSTVVKCFLFQSMEDGDYGPAGVFGSFQQQNIEVVYDLEKERIGFQPTDCASSAASQGLGKM